MTPSQSTPPPTIDLPVVAEGSLSEAIVERLAPVTDFFAVGEEIWSEEYFKPIAYIKNGQRYETNNKPLKLNVIPLPLRKNPQPDTDYFIR